MTSGPLRPTGRVSKKYFDLCHELTIKNHWQPKEKNTQLRPNVDARRANNMAIVGWKQEVWVMRSQQLGGVYAKDDIMCRMKYMCVSVCACT